MDRRTFVRACPAAALGLVHGATLSATDLPAGATRNGPRGP